jgi:glycosyltransferase involved in cell wall biosynthesis
VSDEDRRLLLEVAPDLDNLHVVPNGVDVSRHNPELRQPRAGVILYNGALTYGANLDAVRYYAASIHPILSQRIPGVRLRVTGRYDGVDLSGIKGCAGIELTGYVEDIRTELSSASVCLVPLREGGGTRLKILEAMAAGVPVVATSVGAEGIDVVDHEHILIADAPEDIAQAVATVLCDSVIAATLSCNARRLVETKYDWSAVGRSFVGVVESMPLDGDAQGLSSQKS